MTRRKGGLRRKSRRILTKPTRSRGKVSLTRFFSTYKAGDRVCFVQEPSFHKGQFHTRFHGKQGVIQSRRGFCYVVEFYDKDAKKTLIMHPLHMKRMQ